MLQYITSMHETHQSSKPSMESFVKHSVLCLVPFLLLVVVAAVAEAAGDDGLTTFIIHVHPHEDHTTADDRKAWYTSFLPEHGRLVHAYHHVATGFAARLTRRELGEMSSAMPGFLTAIPDEVYEPLTTHTPEFLGLVTSGANGNRSSAFGSERGAGVIVGVLDTGVFPFHPSFSDAGMPPPPAKWKGRCDFVNASACNNKLIGARSFVMPPNVTNNSSSPTKPFDDGGHGTHTASTAAGTAVRGAHVLGQASGTAMGMAPRAHVAMYKVCNETACLSSDVLAGVEAAVADGCDVLSLSLGAASRPFYRDPIAIGTFGAVEKGVFVAMAAGNSGPNASSLSNEAPWVLTVAASTIDRSIRSTVQLGNGASFHGQSTYQPVNVSSSTNLYPLVYAGAASRKPGAALCAPGSLDGADVRNKIVICQLGAGPGRNISRIMKGEVVRDAGGAGMILVNGFSVGYTTLADAHVLPASHVDYAAIVAIMSYINSTPNPVARIVFGGTVLGTSPAPVIAAFSSRGPGQQDPSVLKPDVTGPGVNILAAWPTQVGPVSSPPEVDPTAFFFNIISGTSMSTPHLSGIAAAIKSIHPTWSPAAVKSAIMTTADPTDRSSGRPILDEQHKPADWFAAGAGHVSPERAADPGLVYDIAPADYIGYLCGLYSSENVSVIARRRVNCSAVAVVPGSELNYPSISVVFPRTWNWSTAMVVRRTAKNVGKVAAATYVVTVDMPAGGDVAVDVSPRQLVFTEVGQERSFEVAVRARRNGGKVVQGALRWVSGSYTVRSPISVSFD